MNTDLINAAGQAANKLAVDNAANATGQAVTNALDKAFLSGPIVYMAVFYGLLFLAVLVLIAWLLYKGGSKVVDGLEKLGDCVQNNTVATARVETKVATLVDLKQQQVAYQNIKSNAA